MGSRAIDSARRSGDRPTLVHALKTSLWHGLTPDVAATQLARSTELARLCTEAGERETLSMASYFRAVVSYLAGRPDDLAEATADLRRAAESPGQPWHNYFAGLRGPGPGVLPRATSRRPSSGPRRRCSSATRSGKTPPTAPTACRCS